MNPTKDQLQRFFNSLVRHFASSPLLDEGEFADYAEATGLGTGDDEFLDETD